MSSRIVTVFGATGKQGSSVVRALLEKGGTFIPRAVTRDAQSASTIALKEQGAQVVQADLTKQEEVENAARGSEAFFIVTVPFVPSFTEKQQGEAIIDACKTVGIKFIVWSSLPGATKRSGTEFTELAHFDDKAAVDDYLRASGIPHAILHTQFFLENILDFHMIKPSLTKDEVDLIVPRIGLSVKHCCVWVAKDLGVSVVALLKGYNEPSSAILGETFDLCGSALTVQEMADAMGEVIGKKVNPISPPSWGTPELDETIDFDKKYRSHPHGIPDRRLLQMGVEFGTIKQFYEANLDRLKVAIAET